MLVPGMASIGSQHASIHGIIEFRL